MAQQQKRTHWSPAWIAVVAALGSAAVVLAVQVRLLPLDWWGFPFMGVAGAFVTALITIGQNGLLRTHAHRTLTWLSAGGWTAWAIVAGWTHTVWLAFFGGGFVLAALAYPCRTPKAAGQADDGVSQAGADRRPDGVRAWEALLRRLAKAPVTVAKVEPWDNPANGERVYVELPAEGEITAQNIVDICPKIAVAKRLPRGCLPRVLDGDHQGAVVLDVMLRDCLTDSNVLLADDFSPVSVYDSFQVMTTPRGESLEVCLRSQSMVIGGAPESGKTTLLHRIILWLARCVDCLIWVVDANGGGVAEPWVRPWAMGKAGRPIIDWVAADEDEAAVLVAVATAIAKDRKTSPEAVCRRHGSDTTVLPVDEKLPAIVVLNDEGGEMRQAVSALGQLADQGISRLAQIGRAEAVRTIKSVLRGTADLLDKGMRVCAALRICLRMEEEDEYAHVLGKNPGKTALLHKGSGYLRRPEDPRPIFGRTVNMLLSQIERAAVACADLRPDLDDRARKVAARIRARDVLGGRDPDGYPDVMALPVMRDVEAGLAYGNRWVRFAPRLAAMRGEELAEPDQADEVVAPAAPAAKPAPAVAGPALSALLAAAGTGPVEPARPADRTPRAVELTDKAAIDREAQRLLAEVDWHPGPRHAAGSTVTEQSVAKMTTREHVGAILVEAYPEALTPGQIGERLEEREAGVQRTYLQDVLRAMLQAGEIVRPTTGRYTVVVAK
jgi:hypothetical protein